MEALEWITQSFWTATDEFFFFFLGSFTPEMELLYSRNKEFTLSLTHRFPLLDKMMFQMRAKGRADRECFFNHPSPTSSS